MQLEIQLLKQVCEGSINVTEQLHEEIIRTLTNFVTAPSVGSPSSPAANCSEIFRQDSTATSGTYWLSTGDGAVNVTCDFDVQLPPPSPVMGWQEIANINMSDPTNSCPSPLRETTSPSRRCEQSSDSAGCESVFFPTNSVPFSKLCGRVVGYASDTVDAVSGVDCSSGCGTIDGPYVDGVSITYSNSSGRAHIWTLVAEHQTHSSRCPCGNPAYPSPSFVGNDYYCEVLLDTNSPLWEGEGCSTIHAGDAPCCENPNLPWFCREFDQPIVTDNIEVRMCRDGDRNNENIFFDLLKMYIQ